MPLNITIDQAHLDNPELGFDLDATAKENLNAEMSDNVAAPDEALTEQPAAVPTSEVNNNPTEVTNKPSDISSRIQEAMHNGYSLAEVQTYLAGQGYDEDDAHLIVTDSVKNKVIEAKQEGYNDDEIKDYLIQNNYDGEVIDNSIKAASIDDKFKRLDFDKSQVSDADKAMDISDLYKNVYQKYSTMGKQVLGVMDEQTALEARREINQLNASVAEKLRTENIDAFIDSQNGEVMMKDKDGQIKEVDSSFINSMVNSKGEFAGAIAGGIAGARGGALAGSLVAPGAGTAVGAVAGGIAGSMLGAAGGRGLDLMLNAKELSEKLSTRLYMTQMKEAGIFDGVVGVLGAGAIKMTAKGYRSIVKSYKYFSSGNPRGAYKALKENLNINDEQIKALVDTWEKTTGQTAPGGTFERQAIGVVTQTMQGAQTAVRSAAAKDERVATIIKASIDERAKSLVRATNEVTDENIGKLVREDLTAYQKDVKDYYDVVKKEASSHIDGTDFRFDLDKLAIQPVMKDIEKRISNPMARERYINYASRIENASADRKFSGLLELRAAVNDFKYSKTLSTPDLEALNTVINKIDGQMSKAVKGYMSKEDGKAWIANFAKAKSEYAKMKQLQENTLFRLINRAGITEDGIQKAISKYSDNKDVNAEIFNPLVERLAPVTRSKVEGAAIKNLVAKNTFGEASEQQAIHFPALSESLKELNITTPTARNLVRAVDEIAKLYRNDPELAGISGRTVIEKMQASLSSDIVQKAKFAFIGEVWQTIVKYAPTKGARNMALIHQVGDLLRNPLHSATVENVVKQFPKDKQEGMRSLIKELQAQQAMKGPQSNATIINMYKQSETGNIVVTNGALGKGIYLVDKVKAPKNELKVGKHEVDLSRLATVEAIGKIVGRDIDEEALKTIPNLQRQLIDKGYLGIRMEGKAMLFPETTVGVKTPMNVEPKIVRTTSKVKVNKEDEITYIVDMLNNGSTDPSLLHDAEKLGYRLVEDDDGVYTYTLKDERGRVMTEPAIRYDLVIQKKVKFYQEFQLLDDNDVPLSLMGHTLQCVVKESPKSPTILHTLTEANGGMISLEKITNATLDKGCFAMEIHANATDLPVSYGLYTIVLIDDLYPTIERERIIEGRITYTEGTI